MRHPQHRYFPQFRCNMRKISAKRYRRAKLDTRDSKKQVASHDFSFIIFVNASCWGMPCDFRVSVSTRQRQVAYGYMLKDAVEKELKSPAKSLKSTPSLQVCKSPGAWWICESQLMPATPSWVYLMSVGVELSPCRVGIVVSVSASRTVVREFTSRLGHTKDHHNNGTNCLPAWHAMR